MNATSLSVLPAFVEWYKGAKEIVAEAFGRLTEEQKFAADFETVEDFALEVYAATKGLTPAEPVVS